MLKAGREHGQHKRWETVLGNGVGQVRTEILWKYDRGFDFNKT